MTGRARSASGLLAFHMRRLGRKDMLELTRILTMNSPIWRTTISRAMS